MRYIPLAVLAASLLAPHARADKFWLGNSETEKQALPGSSPNCIEGVLLSEDQKSYQIRVVGGEVTLDKKLVYKVEKDGLTLEAITRSETAAAEARSKEPAVPPFVPAPMHNVAPADAGFQPSDVAPPAEPDVLYDPVVRRAVSSTASDREVQRELRSAYEQTRDRAFLTELRRLRRMR